MTLFAHKIAQEARHAMNTHSAHKQARTLREHTHISTYKTYLLRMLEHYSWPHRPPSPLLPPLHPSLERAYWPMPTFLPLPKELEKVLCLRHEFRSYCTWRVVWLSCVREMTRQCVHTCVHGGIYLCVLVKRICYKTGTIRSFRSYSKDTKKDEDARKRYRRSTVESPSSAVEISDKNFRINIVFLPFRVEWGLFVCCMPVSAFSLRSGIFIMK